MNSAATSAQSATPPLNPAAVPYAAAGFDVDDLALGWECANPALQIDVWQAEAQAQPLKPFY